MSKIYFVNHPEKEPPYTNGMECQIIEWNCTKKHWRKLIKHDGVYLSDTNSSIRYAPLYFWGEYEPYSCAHINRGQLPAIHDDLKSARGCFPTPLSGMNNTDPYVFGPRFKYICCKKSKRANLNKFDIVVFGHYMSGANLFYFDTVFVCKDDGKPVPTPDFENQYYMAGVRPCGSTKSVYAEGLMYIDGEPIFSFVPCHYGDASKENLEFEKAFPYYELPAIDLSAWLPSAINPRTRHVVEFEPWMWKEIVEAVKKRGMCFGVHLAEI